MGEGGEEGDGEREGVGEGEGKGKDKFLPRAVTVKMPITGQLFPPGQAASQATGVVEGQLAPCWHGALGSGQHLASVRCVVCSVQCAGCSAQCAVCSVQCSV